MAESPSLEDEAKFYLTNSISLVGYEDTLATLTGDAPNAEGPAGDASQAVRNLSISFHEGVQRNMQNSREHGSHPINAFGSAVDNDWPDWVQAQIADSEHGLYVNGFEQTEEENEYIQFLEDNFGVPL